MTTPQLTMAQVHRADELSQVMAAHILELAESEGLNTATVLMFGRAAALAMVSLVTHDQLGHEDVAEADKIPRLRAGMAMLNGAMGEEVAEAEKIIAAGIRAGTLRDDAEPTPNVTILEPDAAPERARLLDRLRFHLQDAQDGLCRVPRVIVADAIAAIEDRAP